MVKGISVLIPNFNGRTLLEQTIPTVVDALMTLKIPWEIIVSDDCSTDDSLVFLNTQFPFVRTCANSVNTGFAPALNRALYMAIHSHVLMLNSDVKLTPYYFQPQIPYFEDTDAFGVMGRIIGWEDEKLQDGGKYPYFHGLKLKTSRNFVPRDPCKEHQKHFSFYLSGANAFIDRGKLLKLGGLDELFAPFYIEDVDLSIRAWRLGWKCYYEHNSVCRHKVSASIKSARKRNFVRVIYNRNKMYFHAIHLTKARRYAWFFQLGLETGLRLILLDSGWIKVIVNFIRHYDGVRKSRLRFVEIADGRPVQNLEKVVLLIQSSLKEAGARVV